MNKAIFFLLAALLMGGCSSNKAPNSGNSANADNNKNADATSAVADQAVAKQVAQTAAVAPSVYYDYNSAVIQGNYKQTVVEQAKYLTSHPNAKVEIDGNCDERGSAEYNLSLGQRRADALGKMLVTMGAGKNQIKTVSHGKEQPKATCHEESCWKENRRADIISG